jgi:myosin-1
VKFKGNGSLDLFNDYLVSFRISNILLQANVILETFGNSRTNRNDNSSRFGKYMDLNFDSHFDLIGGKIQHYLLEKSRVVKQQLGERNFHAFYQLFTNESIRLKYGLNLSPEEYHYINQGNCSKIEKINDQLNYEQVMEALEIVGFKEEEILTIWKIIAAIIHLVSMNCMFN